MRRLYVGALPFRATEQTIRQLFAPYGPVGKILVFANWQDPTFEPHALIELEQVDKAVVDLDGRKIGATHLRVHEEVASA